MYATSVSGGSKPVPVTLNGNRGVHLELVTIPVEIDAGTCVRDNVALVSKAEDG